MLKVHVDRFYHYLDDLNNSYSKLTALLFKKLAAIEANDVNTLSDIINEEQAYVMKSRGFDQNIAMYREYIGFQGEALSDIIKELPADQQGRFTLLHTKLKSSVEEAKALNEKCQNLTEIRLHEINRNIGGTGSVDPRPKSPKPDKPKIPPAAGFFSKSV